MLFDLCDWHLNTYNSIVTQAESFYLAKIDHYQAFNIRNVIFI